MMRYLLLLILCLITVSPGRAGNLISYPLWVPSAVVPGAEKTYSPKSEEDAYYDALVSNGFQVTSNEGFTIQIGAFKTKVNAEVLCKKVKDRRNLEAEIFNEAGFFKVRVRRVNITTKTGLQIADIEPDKLIIVSSDSFLKDGSIYREITPGDSIIRKDSIAGAIQNDTVKSKEILSNTLKAADRLANAAKGLFIIRGESPWLKRINYFGKSLIFVNSLILTIIISIATMVVLLFIILMNRRKMEKEEQLHQYLMEKYQGLIVDYLFGTASQDDFKRIASDSYRRQVLIDQMIDVSINLKGEESKKLLNLYLQLNLDKDSIAKANDYRWHIKIKGFRELAFMNIRKGNDAMYRVLNSKNEILRMEALITLARLSEENHFDFLSNLKTPFSLWEQITLHDLIIQHNIPLPSFQKWLDSPNPTVAMFCLRMIREFKQKEAEEKVKETLLHPNRDVRFLAVQVAGDMEMRSTLETMKSMYKNQDNKICLEIVKSMGKMPDPSMMNFLKLVLDKEDDVQLQIEATKAIENNGEEGVKALVKLMKSEYKNYNIIIRHVLDRRIF
jgi:hypothetical protein